MKKFFVFLLLIFGFLGFFGINNQVEAQEGTYCTCDNPARTGTICVPASECVTGCIKLYNNPTCSEPPPSTSPIPSASPTPSSSPTPSASPTPGGASKSNWKAPCVGAEGTLSSDVATLQGIQCLIANVLGHILSFFGIIGFCMFIYGSVMLMLSRGQPNALETAKDTLTYAILGIILALSAFIIINLLSYFTGIDSLMTIEFIAKKGST